MFRSISTRLAVAQLETARIHPPSLLLTSAILLAFAGDGYSQVNPQPAAPAGGAERTGGSPGQFLTIEEPIDSEVLTRIKNSAKQVLARSSQKGSDRPILVFEIRPGKVRPGGSEFGSSYDLANFLSTELEGAKMVVAYVPEPLQGYATLAALACEEIVMGPDASLGPITPEGSNASAGYKDPIRFLATRRGREPDLFLGMFDRNLDLRTIRTADKQLHHVLAENVAEFTKNHQVIDDSPAWGDGRRGVLSARKARDEGFAKLIADNRMEIANFYDMAGKALANDPTLLAELKPVWIQIEGRLDTGKESYLRRRIEQARVENANMILFQISSEGGIDTAADNVAGLIAGLKDMKTVAYIDDRALGVATLIPLACDEIFFQHEGRIGDVRLILPGSGRGIELSAPQVAGLSKRAEALAAQKGHPPAVARAMIERNMELWEAKDAKTGARVFLDKATLQADPARYLEAQKRKEAGERLTLVSNEAASFGLGQEVSNVEDLKSVFGLRGKIIKIERPTWVDGLVAVLTTPTVSWLLLFVGIFMLILEVKIPGTGLSAIISALAFILFFWSRYLTGTADQLEILLFLVGIVCLAMELFVFPGFGVFGMSGIVLILVSIVMASHTFVWPTQEYEYRQMAGTLLQLTAVLVTVAGGAVLLGRYFPSLPIFNRMVLKAEPWNTVDVEDPFAKPSMEGYESLAFLLGESGRTTTVLRPTGKAKFGEMVVEVTAPGAYLDPDTLVEVIEVQGKRIVVRPVG